MGSRHVAQKLVPQDWYKWYLPTDNIRGRGNHWRTGPHQKHVDKCPTCAAAAETAAKNPDRRRLLGAPSETVLSVLLLSILLLVVYFVVRRFGFQRSHSPRFRTTKGRASNAS